MQDAIPDELHADAPQPTAVVTSAAAVAKETTSPPAPAAALLTTEQLHAMAIEAASRGRDTLVAFYAARSAKEKVRLKNKFGEHLDDLVKLYPVDQFGSNRRED
jgi:hypothetical protein